MAHFGKSNDAFEDTNRPLYLGAHPRFGVVLALLVLIELGPGFHLPTGHVLRRGLMNRLGLSQIPRDASHSLSPCNRSGSLCTSCTLAAAVHIECTTRSLEPMPLYRLGAEIALHFSGVMKKIRRGLSFQPFQA